MRIGEVARLADVNVQTLRYYERRGLLAPPPRTPGGYRIYPTETVTLVRFIKALQVLGFTLCETADILRLRETLDPLDARLIAAQARDGVRARMDRLKTIDTALTHLLASADSADAPTRTLDARLIETVGRLRSPAVAEQIPPAPPPSAR